MLAAVVLVAALAEAGGAQAQGLEPLLVVPDAGAEAPGQSPLALPGLPSPDAPGDTVAAPPPAASVAALLDQANFWLAQNNPGLAQQTLARALRVEPDNLAVLATASEIASRMGRTEEAAEYLARLRRLAPGDPRLGQAEAAAREAAVDPGALAEARELAGSGRAAEAVRRYQQVFGGAEPPANHAVEYYQVLAGSSENGHAEATAGLERLIRRTPGNPALQLAYAQLLTYREHTRDDGINRLRQLSRQPATAVAARQAWRQALLWLGAGREAADYLEAYLAANPADAEISAKLAEARANMISPAAEARILGWSVLRTDRAEAERQFQLALDGDPRDAEAIIGMAVVRQMQGRLPDGRQLLDQALAIAPDRREELLGMMGNGPGTVVGGPGAAGTRAGPSNATIAWRALDAGDLDRADSFARRATRARGNERVQGEVVLGQVALRREDFPTAETRFRAALALRPRLPAALAGLHDSLLRQGRFAEADALQQETGMAAAPAATRRAYAIRDQAVREESPARRIALLREALDADPANPWIRFDLARQLQDSGEQTEARLLTRQLAEDTSPEGSAAAALLAAEDDRPGEVIGLLERVPVRLRTADMNRLLARSRQEAAVLALEQQVREGRPEARRQLTAMAATRDPSGATAAAVVRSFGRLGDASAALSAARGALAANPAPGPAMRLFVAGALASAGHQDAADALVAPLADDPGLDAEQRRQVANLQSSATAVRVDRLSAAGQRGEAYRQLLPAMQRQPESPLLNAALVRLYLANRQFDDAREAAEALLAQDARNREARAVLIEVAVTQGYFARAEQLVAEGKALHPDDMPLLLAEARLARARGDMPRTQRLLEAAARRRIAELRAAGATAEVTLTADLLSPRRAASRAGQEPEDPLSAELVRDLLQARAESAIWLQAGMGVRSHSGTAGLGRLREVTTPVELSMPVPGVGGRLYAQASTVALNSGGFGAGTAAAGQFGLGPLAAGDAAGKADRWVSGVGLGLGYATRNIRVDIGTTPLGFQETNVVGGAELALPLSPSLMLRVQGERRAVTESLLSYAGQRDPETGRSWGGVTRTGLRGQLQYNLTDRLGIYGGGGIATLRGNNVARNDMLELGGGMYYGVIRTPEQDLTIGPDLRYVQYDRNLGGFTYGQGGYFSPQSHVAASVQASWRRQWGDLTARAQGSVGVQRFTQDASAVFPKDAGLQARLEQSANPAVASSTPGQTTVGFTGGIMGNLEYALTPDLRLGAAAQYSRAGDYSEANGLFYLRWRLDRPPADLAPLLAGAPTSYPAPSWPLPSTLANGAPEPVQLTGGAARPVW